MSRSDRIVNILLALAWVLLIVRVGRIYFDSSTPAPVAGAGGDSFDEPAPSPIVLPTPTAITGPQQLRPIVGKCHYFLATDGSQKFEFCAFRSVRQILLSNYRSVVTGHWKGWKTETEGGKTKYVSQLYDNGDECPGFGKRETVVEYTCKKEAKGLELVSLAEYDVCKYKMVLALPQWCDVQQ